MSLGFNSRIHIERRAERRKRGEGEERKEEENKGKREEKGGKEGKPEDGTVFYCRQNIKRRFCQG